MESLQEQNHQTSVFVWGFLVKGKQMTQPTVVKELQNKGIKKVSSGGFYFICLSQNGEVWAWGNGKNSRYSIDCQFNQIPKCIPLKIKAVQISAGNWHSMILDSQGIIYSCGHNKYGSCGIQSFQNVQSYTKCTLNESVKKISCGDGFSLAITKNGQLYTCGFHEYHGHKNKDNINKFKKIKLQQIFCAISAGFTHSLAITQKGQIYSWGDGTFYQLGHGNKNHCQEPKIIEKLNGVKIINAACTRGQKNCHSMAISQSGEVYSWGAGYKGKLGHQANWSHAQSGDQPYPKLIKHIQGKVIKAGGGGIHSTLLDQQGNVYSFGCGSNGRLGHKQSQQYVYLYRQGYPRKIDSLNQWKIIDLSSSYYHNVCVGKKRMK